MTTRHEKRLRNPDKVAAMWVVCPFCGAPEGFYCESEFGATRYEPHRVRYLSAGRTPPDRKKSTPVSEAS